MTTVNINEHQCQLFQVFHVFQPGVSEETRKAIGEAAVRAAKAVNYVGAGTYTRRPISIYRPACTSFCLF